jgi:hypothetical protein
VKHEHELEKCFFHCLHESEVFESEFGQLLPAICAVSVQVVQIVIAHVVCFLRVCVCVCEYVFVGICILSALLCYVCMYVGGMLTRGARKTKDLRLICAHSKTKNT